MPANLGRNAEESTLPWEEPDMRSTWVSASVLSLAMIVASTPAWAACSNASFKGIFGYAHGRTGGGGTARMVVGQITADGSGHVSGSWTMSVTGTISMGSFDGTYNIAANCTGTLTLATEDFTPANFNIVLDNAHQGFQMIQIDSGTAQPGSGIAQGVATCGIPGKKRTLATYFLGTLFPSSDVEAISGRVIFDGAGNISGTETFSVGGVISVVPVTGTYSESNNCIGNAQIIPLASPATNFRYIVVNGGKKLLLIETDDMTLVAGNAQQ